MDKRLNIRNGQDDISKPTNSISILGLDVDVDIEYVSAEYTNVSGIDPALLDHYRAVAQRFSKPEELLSANISRGDEESKGNDDKLSKDLVKKDDELAVVKTQLSKKKKKLLSRMSIAELKRSVIIYQAIILIHSTSLAL